MRSLLAILIFTPVLHAATLAGAWETFPTKANADAWSLYSYADKLFAPPPWANPVGDDNPYVYSYFLRGKGVWFIADELTAQGAFVGDYAAQKISGIDVSINIDPAELDFIDLTVYADGPSGLTYYFSQIIVPEDLGLMPDWYIVNFSFVKNWYSYQDGVYTPFKPNRKFLKSIQEIGVRIFPATGVTGESFVNLDDFILIPTLEAPPLATSLSGSNFVLQFTPNPGVSVSIEKLTPTLIWQSVVGKTDLIGSQTFTTPVTPRSGIFRVAAKEKLTIVTSP